MNVQNPLFRLVWMIQTWGMRQQQLRCLRENRCFSPWIWCGLHANTLSKRRKVFQRNSHFSHGANRKKIIYIYIATLTSHLSVWVCVWKAFSRPASAPRRCLQLPGVFEWSGVYKQQSDVFIWEKANANSCLCERDLSRAAKTTTLGGTCNEAEEHSEHRGTRSANKSINMTSLQHLWHQHKQRRGLVHVCTCVFSGWTWTRLLN